VANTLVDSKQKVIYRLNQMTISYRKADFNNSDEMKSIAAIDMTIPALFDPLFEVNEKTISKRLEQLMKCKPDDFFEVAVNQDGKIIGYHFMNQFISSHGVQAADVQTLWVDPEFRKQGIARTMKQHGEAWAKSRNLDHISTFVHGKNSSMQNLNKNLGYELIGYKLRKSLK
jgi:ribosomal protein S18 acetylase RimI-like enzyme